MKSDISKEDVEKFMDYIIDLHDTIIEETGGEKGIRDEGGLYNSIFKILSFWKRNLEKPFLSGAFIYSEFAKRHYFVDGNKRTAHVFAKAFLISEGFHFLTPYKTAVEFIISIARDNLSINKIRKWLESNSIKIEERDIETYIKKTTKELFDDVDDNKR